MNAPTIEQIEDEIRQWWREIGVPQWAIEASPQIVAALAYERQELWKAADRFRWWLEMAKELGDDVDERAWFEYRRAEQRYHEMTTYLSIPICRVLQRSATPIRIEVA